MGEQEKFARVREAMMGNVFDVNLSNGVTIHCDRDQSIAESICSYINEAHAQSLARFRERCIQAVKQNEGDWLVTSDRGAGYARARAAAIKAILEVPL